MPIEATCPGCNEFFRLPDELAGKEVCCQRCQTLWTVPGPATAPEEPEVAEAVDENPPAVPAFEPDEAEPVEEIEPVVADLAQPVAEPKETRNPSPPAPRRKPANPSSNVGCWLAALVLFLLGMIGAGGLAAFWVAMNLVPANPVLVDVNQDKDRLVAKDFDNPRGDDKAADKDREPRDQGIAKDLLNKDLLFLDKDLTKDKDKDGRLKDADKVKKDGPAPPPIVAKILDPKARVAFADQLKNGRRDYKVFLQFGKRYNFHVTGLDFAPLVQINDGVGIAASRVGNKAVFLSHVALRTGEHTLTVLPQAARNAGGFDFAFAQAMPELPTSVVSAGNFTTKDQLRIHDGVAADWPASPNREYRMPVTAGFEYELNIDPVGFAPRLRVYEGANIDAPNRVGDWPGNPATKKIDAVYKSTFSGAVTITVASDDQTFGSYALTIKRRPFAVAKERPGPRDVAFDFAGKFHKDDLLDDNDPFEGRHGRSKVYVIPMDAGQSYNIDQKSKDLDAFLTLLDPQGKLVAEDNNSGGNYNARILFDAKETGKYRLLASDFKRKTGDFAIDIARSKTPTSVPANGVLLVNKRQQDGCEISDVTMTPIASQNTSFAWSHDGRAFFTLDKNNMLRRYRFPDMVEDRRLEMGAGVNALHLCAEGLLVSNTSSRELWIIDPVTMELKRRLPRLGNTGTFTAPTLASAFVPGNLMRPDGSITPGLGRHDLKKSAVSYVGDLPKGTIFQAITPDEKYLLARSPENKMMRLRLDKKTAAVEQISASNARNWFGANHPYLVSPDGRLVLHPVNTKTIPKDDVQPAPPSGYGIAAYRVTDLRRPIFVFDTGVSTTAVTFDPKSGYIIAQNRSKGIMVIDTQGQLVRSFNIDFGPGAIDLWNMVAHPGGGKIVGFTGPTTAPKLFVIDLPRDLPVPKVVEDKGEPRKVAFNATDFYRNDDRLAANDPRDDDGNPHKTYLIPMEAGWAYSIDQKSTQFDSFLKLYDPAGKLLATDDDSGGDVNARILFEPKASGEYRVVATRFKAGGANLGEFIFEVVRFKIPIKEAVNKSLALKKAQVAGANIVETQIGQMPLPTNSCVFAPDGKAILVLDADGWLRKVSVPDLIEVQRLQLGRDFKQVFLGPDGVVTSNVKLREIWVIDPVDLRLTKRVPMVGGPQLHVAADAPVAFTPANAKFPDGKITAVAVGHDLTGKLPPIMSGLWPGVTGVYAITPDGKFLLGRAPDNKLARWKIADRRLGVEQVGDLYSTVLTTPPVFVSADNRWLMRAFDQKAAPLDNVQLAPASGFGWIVYHVKDLTRPAFAIDTESKSWTAASDPKSGHLITHSGSKGLLVCDLDGKILRQIPIAVGAGLDARVWRIAVSTQGGKLIAFTGTKGASTAIYVELPKDLAAVKTVPDRAGPIEIIKGREFPRGLDPLPMPDGGAVIRKLNGVFQEPLWSLDGKSFFISQSQHGFLEVDARDFTIRKKNLDLADTKSVFFRGQMAWSAEGLLTVGFDRNPNMGAAMDLFIIDPVSLAVKKRIPVPNTMMVQSAPNLSVAFAGGRNSFAGGNPAEMLIVDLKTGKVTKPNVDFAIIPETFKVSPDGKYLYATDGKTIARFKIDGTNLVQEEVSQNLDVNKFQPRLELSADGKLVWLLSQNIPASQAKVDSPTSMLNALNLDKVEKVVNKRAYSIAVDPGDQSIVLAGGDRKLRELDKDQANLREYDAKLASSRPSLQLNPNGGQVLIFSGSNVVYHVRLPDRKAPMKK